MKRCKNISPRSSILDQNVITRVNDGKRCENKYTAETKFANICNNWLEMPYILKIFNVNIAHCTLVDRNYDKPCHFLVKLVME